MASLIISSAAVTAVSQTTSSQAREVVVPFNSTKLSNSASSLVAAPFTGLKSNSTFPMNRKVDNITSLSSNGGRAKCVVTDGSSSDEPLKITKHNDGSWIDGNDGSIRFNDGDLKNWVEVDVSKLNRGRKYQVVYYVTMESSTVASFFTLSTTYPSGTKSIVTKEYTVKPGDSAAISFEAFNKPFKNGIIKFTLDSSTPTEWVGLIIEEAVISLA